MNIERIPEYLLRWGVTLFGIVLSIYLVQQTGYGNYGRVALVLVGLGLFCLLLIFRERIWILLPVAWALTGQIPELGIPFTVRELLILTIFVSFLAFKAFKMVNRQPVWNWTLICAVIFVLYVGIGWIRNPVGFEAVKSDRVGGRP
jgi:hypothetical protein